MKGHLKHMLISGVVLLAVLLIAGVDFGRALPYALLLACPLSMAAMMFMMSRKSGDAGLHHHQSGRRDSDTPASADEILVTSDNHDRIS